MLLKMNKLGMFFSAIKTFPLPIGINVPVLEALWLMDLIDRNKLCLLAFEVATLRHWNLLKEPGATKFVQTVI